MELAFTTTERVPVAEEAPEEAKGIGDSKTKKKKRQRQNHAHHCQELTRARFPANPFPAKFGCQPIKLELHTLTHTYAANN